MTKWSYNYATIEWDSKKKNWACSIEDKQVLGFSTILNLFGEHGWELVNMSADGWTGASAFDGSSVIRYRAFFKQLKT